MTLPLTPNSPSSIRFDTPYLRDTLESLWKQPISSVEVSPIDGDASDRRYFRVSYQDNAGNHSLVLMHLMEPEQNGEPPFIRILNFLERLELAVPRLHFYDPARGLLLLEDCGDDTLEGFLVRHPEKREVFYKKAVELLVRLQARATPAVGPECPAYPLRFDVEKLMWEMDFMLQHYVKGLHDRHPSPGALSSLRAPLEELCGELARQPLCFAHRDYHSRNLMVNRDMLVMLDFQDARMGPCQYDLASLLKDSYVQLDPEFRLEMMDHFIGLKEEAEGTAIERKTFHRVFDLMSIQRNLKAVGTFAFQHVAKGRERYLKFIPPTLGYVRETLERRPDLADLKTVLENGIPGLKK